MPERGPINEHEILDYAVRKNHINTGAVITAKLDDYTVKEGKIATGEVSHKKLDEDHGTETAVPSADTEVAHNLGKTPTKVELTEKSTGVLDNVYLSAKSATSITIQAGTSGVDVFWQVM